MSITATNITCYNAMNNMADFFSCLVTVPGVQTWNILFISILVLSVGGWSWFRNINEGLMIGGFLSSLLGLGFVALELVSVSALMIAVLMTVVGITITAIKRNSND